MHQFCCIPIAVHSPDPGAALRRQFSPNMSAAAPTSCPVAVENFPSCASATTNPASAHQIMNNDANLAPDSVMPDLSFFLNDEESQSPPTIAMLGLSNPSVSAVPIVTATVCKCRNCVTISHCVCVLVAQCVAMSHCVSPCRTV